MSAPLPGVVQTGFRRIGYELKVYLRSPDSMIFNFAFPLLMLVIFTVAFSSTDFGATADGTPLTSAEYYLPAMVAMGIFISGAQNLGIDIAVERNDGTLTRLAGSPIAPLSYFIGKFGQVLLTGFVQLVLLVIVGGVLLGGGLPQDALAWFTLGWVFLLGIMASATLGISLSAIPRSAKSASSVIIPPILILQFISGVYLVFADLPTWMQNIASVFPLKWIAQGARSVFLPESYQAMEVGGSWNLPAVALVLGVWLVLGTLGGMLTFRWMRRS